ncbi:MAG TPA: hypothetical protein VHJ78_08850 [Actinomycetota bacterium]|nr:hypothetical protein [Actinomycetota bacterium]
MNGAGQGSNLSAESLLSQRHPNVKDAVCSLPEYQQWVQSLPEVVVDDVTYYVRGGDMLKDFDQVLWEWTRKNRPDLLPPE